MSKRKVGVNNIIYELDNDDIELSSDDDQEPKIKRLEIDSTPNLAQDNERIKDISTDLINIENSCEIISEIPLPQNVHNGGKSSTDLIVIDDSQRTVSTLGEIDNSNKISTDLSQTTIFNEDIVIDSPASYSDLGVVGCENRTPIITVRFKDHKMAMIYKKKIKEFMLKLIKLHEDESIVESEDETDLELDIWPEDLVNEEYDDQKQDVDDNLFFVDTDPCENIPDEIPTYSQASTVMISNNSERESTPPPRKGPMCFNCDGSHQLRDCKLPRNNARIAERRRNMIKPGRYHVEDEQKYGHLVPGRISGHLRHALGLKRHELPLHIYRMRILGYPPGWLEEARISHSGITLFDSSGNATLEPEEEEGELFEPGSKDKFDIKKILDFPGFNVPASQRYKEEAHVLGLPPKSEQDSKLAMLQMLAPNAMKAYKRKKLTFFPSTSANTTQEGQAEMDLDSGDEAAEFPSNPPLPDEAPPAPPPPPPPLPATPPPPDPAVSDGQSSQDEKVDEDGELADEKESSMQSSDWITIDEVGEKSQSDSGRNSPSLDDLEEKKRLLLNALQDDTVIPNTVETEADIDNVTKTSEIIDDEKIGTSIEKVDELSEIETKEIDCTKSAEIDCTKSAENDAQADSIGAKETDTPETVNTASCSTINESDVSKTPDTKAGNVKTTLYGTPVMNIASNYTKLPSDNQFAKDICDVINFENLPNSTGKYKQISHLLRKVKNEVDRIQES